LQSQTMEALQLLSLWLAIVLFATETIVQAKDAEDGKRNGKVLSLFQIIRFPNDPCVGSASKNGTCYTTEECSSRGGSNAGSCASGYGVCCTFTFGCGRTASENCTYFESSGSEVGGCALEVCRCSENVCQLRLDFNQFVITGPSTSSMKVGKGAFGMVTGSSKAVSLTLGSQCLTDTFSVTSPGGGAPPSICGINTGEHMYVDSSESCNDLVFQLGQNGIGAGVAARQWSIKITQYSCDFPNLAPDGCTQYFFGATSQAVQTFNFAGGQHLANQDQSICIRRERGNCRICWTTAIDTDFAVSGMTTMKAFRHGVKAKLCCSYGMSGKKTTGQDCVTIPGAVKTKTTTKQGATPRFCGRSKGLGGDSTTVKGKTICSDRIPFTLRFLSDNFEPPNEIKKQNLGFRLVYFQNSNNC